MYLDFEDYRPEFTPVGRVISIREAVLIAFIVHLLAIIALLVAPKLFPESALAARARALLLAQQRQAQQPRFVFVQPRVDTPARRSPPRADLSDMDRMARTPERPPNPTNMKPFSRGNTPEEIEAMRSRAQKAESAQQPAQSASPPAQADASADQLKLPDAPNRLPMPQMQQTPQSSTGSYSTGGRILHDAIRNLDRYLPQQYDNPGGGGSQIGPLQFDTKGVEFGPWVRRFVAQVRRNWNVPEAAAFMKGHVIITFNVHKNGALTDLTIVGPCPVDAFNTAAYGALVTSNPTYPLPPEYPADKAFFTVTFFYNEQQ